MRSKTNIHLRTMLHPYIFVLKEGKGINDNFFDYSLMMMLINSKEMLPSPPGFKPKPKRKPKLPF